MAAARVPRYLHLPVQILWFDLEDVALIIVCYVIWLMFGNGWTLPLVVLVPRYFMHKKATQPRGWLSHQLYRLGFTKIDSYPSPQAQAFDE